SESQEWIRETRSALWAFAECVDAPHCAKRRRKASGDRVLRQSFRQHLHCAALDRGTNISRAQRSAIDRHEGARMGKRVVTTQAVRAQIADRLVAPTLPLLVIPAR